MLQLRKKVKRQISPGDKVISRLVEYGHIKLATTSDLSKKVVEQRRSLGRAAQVERAREKEQSE